VNWSGREVLVTGATGFIGSHLTERLLTLGATVRAMAHGTGPGSERFLGQCPDHLRKGMTLRGGDLCDKAFVRDMTRGVDTVFHLGGVTSVQYAYARPEEAFRTNVLGTYAVCAAALEAKVRRVVYAASGGEYGAAQGNRPITEDHPLTARNVYTASKLGAFRCCETFGLSYDLPVTVCRIFNTYGPRTGRFLIIPTIITQLMASDTLHLGDLTPTRNFTFIDDIVSAFVRMAEADEVVGKVVHFGSDTAVSMQALVDLIARLMGIEPTVVTDPDRLRPARSVIQCTLTDSSRARKLLGWEPRVSLEDGLRRTIDWVTAGGYDGIQPNQVVD